MKTLIAFLILSAATVANAQTYGLGYPQEMAVQRVVVQRTYGLGPIINRPIIQRSVITVPVVQSVPVVQQSVEVQQPAPVYYSAPVVVSQQRWRMVRQRQCTPNGCRDVWVRVWQ